MSHKDIYVRIRAAVVIAFVCILMIYTITMILGMEQLTLDEEAPIRVTAWLFIALGTAVPCLFALYFAWMISVFVKRDKSFSLYTAKMLKNISNCALIDALYFLAANVVMFVLNYNHPGIALISLALILLALAIGIAFAALARFVQKAADLQEESDLTV
ncbi:MAG: DUF2975 domain-containing protein [Oscillospiraceae bacterium]|nr:DUF2975 domain-containing protein [Oscillospiraceae bacterium]